MKKRQPGVYTSSISGIVFIVGLGYSTRLERFLKAGAFAPKIGVTTTNMGTDIIFTLPVELLR